MQSILEFKKFKKNNKKISMVTCYESWSAKLISQTEVDCILVGDSLGMLSHGFETTVNTTEEMMILHTAAVARSCRNKFIISDFPFMTADLSPSKSIQFARKLIQNGAQGVKIEGFLGRTKLIKKLTDSDIPVMGHLGLTPQSINKLGGYKVQGRVKEQANKIKDQAQKLFEAGCFAIVLECVPNILAQQISDKLPIPIIGIGAGVDVDGQVLVLHDLLGLQTELNPKFVRKFLDGQQLIKDALNNYNKEVKQNSFPNKNESYSYEDNKESSPSTKLSV